MASGERTTFWNTLFRLQTQGLLCDAQLIAASSAGSGDIIPVHKVVLVASSRYFATCLEKDELLETYRLDGISYEDLFLVVQYMYHQIKWSRVSESAEAVIALQTLQVIQFEDSHPQHAKVMVWKWPNSKESADDSDSKIPPVSMKTEVECKEVQTDEEIRLYPLNLVDCSCQTDNMLQEKCSLQSPQSAHVIEDRIWVKGHHDDCSSKTGYPEETTPQSSSDLPKIDDKQESSKLEYLKTSEDMEEEHEFSEKCAISKSNVYKLPSSVLDKPLGSSLLLEGDAGSSSEDNVNEVNDSVSNVDEEAALTSSSEKSSHNIQDCCDGSSKHSKKCSNSHVGERLTPLQVNTRSRSKTNVRHNPPRTRISSRLRNFQATVVLKKGVKAKQPTTAKQPPTVDDNTFQSHYSRDRSRISVDSDKESTVACNTRNQSSTIKSNRKRQKCSSVDKSESLTKLTMSTIQSQSTEKKKRKQNIALSNEQHSSEKGQLEDLNVDKKLPPANQNTKKSGLNGADMIFDSSLMPSTSARRSSRRVTLTARASEYFHNRTKIERSRVQDGNKSNSERTTCDKQKLAVKKETLIKKKSAKNDKKPASSGLPHSEEASGTGKNSFLAICPSSPTSETSKSPVKDIPHHAATGVTKVIVLSTLKVEDGISDSEKLANSADNSDSKEDLVSPNFLDCDAAVKTEQLCAEHQSSNTASIWETPMESSPSKPLDIKPDRIVVKGCIVAPSADELKCPRCSRNFKSISALVIHESRIHKIKREFMCEICGKTYPKNFALILHMRKDHGMTLYSCDHCGAVFKSREGWKIHVYKQHTTDNPKHTCKICGKTFFFKNEMNQHLRLKHSDARPFLCDQCPRAFKSKQMLKRHTDTYHSEVRKFQCDTCGTMFKTKNDMKRHRMTHNAPVDEDGKKMRKIRFPDGQVYPCRHCGKIFKKRMRVLAHENLQHKQRLSGTMYVCTVCNKGFPIKHYLMQHIRNRHTEKRFACERCGVRFNQTAALQKHQQSRTGCKGVPPGPKPYQCSECHKGFTIKANLTRHRSIAGRCRGILYDSAIEYVVVLEQQDVTNSGRQISAVYPMKVPQLQVPASKSLYTMQSSGTEMEEDTAVLHITEDNNQQIHVMHADHAYEAATHSQQSEIHIQGSQAKQGQAIITVPQDVLQLQTEHGEIGVLDSSQTEEVSLSDFVVEANPTEEGFEERESNTDGVIQVSESVILKVDDLQARTSGQVDSTQVSNGQFVKNEADPSSVTLLTNTCLEHPQFENQNATQGEHIAVEVLEQSVEHMAVHEDNSGSQPNIIAAPAWVELDKTTGEIQVSEDILNQLLAAGETLELQVDDQQQEVLIVQPGETQGSDYQTLDLVPEGEDVKQEEQP